MIRYMSAQAPTVYAVLQVDTSLEGRTRRKVSARQTRNVKTPSDPTKYVGLLHTIVQLQYSVVNYNYKADVVVLPGSTSSNNDICSLQFYSVLNRFFRIAYDVREVHLFLSLI